MKSVLMGGAASHGGSDFPVSRGLMAFVCFLFGDVSLQVSTIY